jgi:hypothetical protein
MKNTRLDAHKRIQQKEAMHIVSREAVDFYRAMVEHSHADYQHADRLFQLPAINARPNHHFWFQRKVIKA